MNRCIGYVVVAATSALGGASVAILVMDKKLQKKYATLAEIEIAEAKKFYSKMHKTEKFADPVELAKERTETEQTETLVEKLNYVAPQEVIDEARHEVARNVFTDARLEDGYDYETESQQRDPDKPYIITQLEFMTDDNATSTLTYYEGDDVLADERDEHIREVDETVGEANMLRFGHGSKDPNIVYVRNERLDMDYEVIRSKGKFAEEVLGFVEHSEKRGLRKFRRDDE